MNKKYILGLFCGLFVAQSAIWAGNPDRQGEAGAGQLLINPWARSAGLHSTNTASVTGTDALYLNVAGLARVKKTQLQIGHTLYFQGADIGVNALGFGQKVGKNGVFGLSMVAFDLGDFKLTTTDAPEGAGGTFSPSFFNMGLSYAYLFANKVSVGVTAKFVNESLTDVGARSLGLDAGVQYVTGDNDNFKFGIALRNVGGRMRFAGEGLSKARPNPNDNSNPYPITYYERSATYELPTQLNIGVQYDFLFGSQIRLGTMFNFCSNAFSRDQIGGGMELGVGKNFTLRVAYKTEFDADAIQESLDNGVAGGVSFSVPFKRGSDNRFAIDYGYRATKVFNGIHNLGVRIDL